MNSLAFATAILELLPLVITGSTRAITAMTRGRDALRAQQREGRGPSEEEWAELNDMIAELANVIHARAMEKDTP